MCGIFQLPSSLGNFLLIMVGCLYILCYTFIPQIWYRECRGFGAPPLSARSGIEATALVPILIILSGKTNLISQLTGVSYEKLNIYHRWVSIMCCLLGWVHTLPFYIQAVREGGTERLAWFMSHDNMYRNGIPPLVFLTVLTVFSHSYIRAVWYELWLQVHWVCAVGFYVSLFIHVNGFEGTKYMIATIVFWFTQLTWRAINKSFLRPNAGFLRPNKCRMKRYTSNGDKDHFFEVIIENSNDFTWVPGQHLFIRVPGLRCLENHPFSIVSHYKPRGETDIKLIIKACGLGGMTEHLYKRIPDCGYSESNILVDGPYGGCARPIDAFDCLFLVCSGTGISAILPFLNDACDKLHENDSILDRVRFDWIIKSSDNIEWILPELQLIMENCDDIITSGRVDMNIYFKEEPFATNANLLEHMNTHINSSSESDIDEKYEHLSIKGKYSRIVNMINAKPDAKELVRETCDSLGQRNMYIVSGSDSMKIQVSNAIAAMQTQVFARNGVQEIYLHSESFGW
jgi:predicted ferric reductase